MCFHFSKVGKLTNTWRIYALGNLYISLGLYFTFIFDGQAIITVRHIDIYHVFFKILSQFHIVRVVGCEDVGKQSASSWRQVNVKD